MKILTNWKKRDYLTMALCLLIFFSAAFLLGNDFKKENNQLGDYVEYENGKVIQILSDSSFKDPNAENSWRGEQMMIIEVTSGQYKGSSLKAYNYVGPVYGNPLKVGDRCTLIISTYSDGTVNATVYEYNRIIPILIMLSIFAVLTVMVGGRNGAKSLISLIITVAALFAVLLPALMKGSPTLITTLAVCVFISLLTFVIMEGINRKTLCAWLGTFSGMILALLFAVAAQWLMRVNGYRIEDADALLQLRVTGIPIGIKDLLSAGVSISSLGAVMDVAMSLASSLKEVKENNPSITQKELMKSGMNIGRDIVGTMTNTLILALLGSSLVLILYIYSLALSFNHLISSAYLAIEMVTALSSSIGVILAIPITSLLVSLIYSNEDLLRKFDL